MLAIVTCILMYFHLFNIPFESFFFLLINMMCTFLVKTRHRKFQILHGYYVFLSCCFFKWESLFCDVWKDLWHPHFHNLWLILTRMCSTQRRCTSEICKSSQEIWTDMSYCPLIDPGNPVLPTCSSSTTAVTTKEDVMLTMLTKQLHLNKQETKVNYPETLEAWSCSTGLSITKQSF